MVKMEALSVFLILVMVGMVYGDKTSTAGNITTKVLGRSGKISVYPSDNETNSIMITFDGIFEIDSNNNEIKGQDKHSYQNFAQLDFTFSDITEDNYTDQVHGDIAVNMFTFESDIDISGNVATLKTYVYIFREDGNISVDGENMTVKEGDMKFNIEIKSWPFCGVSVTCANNLQGAFLDFKISIKGQKPSNTSGGSVDVGNGKVFVPTSYVLDGAAKDMPATYPMEEAQGSSTVFTFRFEKFMTSVLYDPVVSLVTEASDGDGGDGGDSGETAEATVSAYDVTAKVLGSSGKMRLSKGDNIITAEIDSIEEMADATTSVKQKDHSYNTMANQEFVLGSVADVDYPNTELATQKVPAVATLSNGAKVTLDIYVFKEAGNITIGTETIMVSQGTVKFTINVMDWPFCTAGTCTNNEVGTLLDIDLKIKGKKSATKEAQSGSKTGQKFDVGDAYATMSEMVVVDSGAPTAMATNYPMLTMKGQVQIFKLRFPKFTTSVMYDPTFDFYTGTNAGNQPVAFPAMLMAAILFLYKLVL